MTMKLLSLAFLLTFAGMSFADGDRGPQAQDEGATSIVKQNRVAAAHGTVMALAFVILFPLGAMVMRIPGLKGALWLHAGAQLFAYLMAIVGLGLGVWLANDLNNFNSDNHPPLGVAVVVLLFFQPLLGVMHHRVFVRERRSSIWTHAHVWYGRVLIAVGIIEGGTGLDLASNVGNQLPSNLRNGKIVYAIMAAFMVALYVGVVLMAFIRRRKTGSVDVPLHQRLGNKPV